MCNILKNFYINETINIIQFSYIIGAPARSRTQNLLIRSQALYPVELQAHLVLILHFMKKNINFIVEESENNLRVDVLINKREFLISRTRIKNLILKEKLKLNDEIIKSPSKKVNVGDKLYLQIPRPEEASLKPYNYKLEIIYEDDDLLVINKPAGIIMHPGAGNYDKTIVNALIHYNKDSLSTIGDELRPGIVHRIDKNTSGLVVVAKNNITHENLSKQFNNHTITRVYQLLVWGKLRPSSGKINTLITRSSKNRQLMEVSSTNSNSKIAPGQSFLHYSPGIPLRINIKKPKKNEAYVLIKKRKKTLKNYYYLNKKSDLKQSAKNLYSLLRKIKKDGYNMIAVEKIPNKGIGKTINDRLSRASKYRIKWRAC